MSARLNRHVDEDSETVGPNRLNIKYYAARQKEDPFPDASLLDPIDEDQHDEIKFSEASMFKSAKNKSISHEQHKALKTISSVHMDIFCCSFSSGPLAKLPPLKIEIMPVAKPVMVRIPKYSAD